MAALTVTAAQGGTGTDNGIALTVRVLTSAAPASAQDGAVSTSSTITTPQQAITPIASGSVVYGAVTNANEAVSFTANGSTTFSQNVLYTGDGDTFGTFRSTGTTTASTPVTVGASAPAGQPSSDIHFAAAEILAAGTIAEDASTPAGVSTTTATTIATASFTPPAGSLLVAQVSSNGTGSGTLTMTVSDSSGLTWVQAAGTTYDMASVWLAQVPAAIPVPVPAQPHSPDPFSPMAFASLPPLPAPPPHGTTITGADTWTGADAATATIGGTVTDSWSGTDTAAVTVQGTVPPAFAAAYSPSGGTATTTAVTAAQSGTGAYDGIALTVRVVTGQAASPAGATASSVAVTTPQLAITPSGSGSWVYGASQLDTATAAFTPAANTAFSANQYWSGDEITFGTFRSSGTTTASTPVTLGATAPAGAAGATGIALLEILANGTLAEDPSTPAPAYTTTAETVSTASFTPPPGSLLVAMVSSDFTGTANQDMTMVVSDSSGLTWTRQVTAAFTAGTGTFQGCTIWTAPVPSSGGGDWTTSTTPKAQTVTAANGNVVLVLGGSAVAATTLGVPSGGPSAWITQQASAAAGHSGGYAWASAIGSSPPEAALTVTTTSLPAATAGAAYSAALAATGGTGAGYAWSVTAGSLPSWAALKASTGVISGTPAAAGTSSFTVTVTDSGGNTATEALSLTANAASSTSPVGPPGTWTLVFDDEFTGTSLNPANWTALQGANINGVTTEASAVSVSGGYLRVGYAGAVNSSPASGYAGPPAGPSLAVGDCVEAMISFPGPSGDTAYNWPSWWASGAPWPAEGEEDIFESYNGTPSALNYHSSSGANNGPFPSGSWCNSFHTYTLVRGATELQVWWDGVLMRTVTRADNGGAQGLIINVGSGNTASTGAVVLVKYVRMWTPG